MKHISPERIITLSFLFFCISCGTINEEKGHPVYKIPLKDTKTSLYDIFEKIELIPLEAIKESFLSFPSEIDVHNDTIFIIDNNLYSINIFAPDGSFVNKVQRVGRGSGEYMMAYDFTLDKKNRRIHILNPQGSLYTYGFDGTFIENCELPSPPYNYQFIETLDDGYFVTWSTAIDESNLVNVIDPDGHVIMNGYFEDSGIWGSFKPSSYFHRYAEDIFYHQPFDPRVYRITPDRCETVYEWEPGVRLVSPRKLQSNIKTINEDKMKLIEELKEGKIPFYFAKQLQSDLYAYAALQTGGYEQRNVFYDKITGEIHAFIETTEGLKMMMTWMNNDYGVGVMLGGHIEGLRGVVSDYDRELLDLRKDTDNHWLVKYTFRKSAN